MWIASRYDEVGNRLQITSSFGAAIDVTRNSLGYATQLTAAQKEQNPWTARIQYNELGQEIERILPGDVISQWQYDSIGRPTHHRVSSQSRFTRRRSYQWGANHRLKGIVNELTGVRTAFGYDEFSSLVWSNEGGQFDFLHHSDDDVGNLYETKDKKDRVYGAGSRLLETPDATFSYDEEGNLVQKVEKNSGATWQYEYTGNGMLAKVIKPDSTVVTFKYDALGRRIEKRSSEKTTMFIWDGNTIFHEYFSVDDSEKSENMSENSPQSNPERPANLITWVFNDGFVPSAKLTNEGNYSIISDYLGTPVEAYDEQGKKVWSAALDIYGRMQEFTGEQAFIPFRYQGQYEDVEIGLYYNRFRYYDPAQGNYTQVDPIGLAGGNPTLYGYVGDPNSSFDPLGLWVYYQLKDATGKIIYHGITDNFNERMKDHALGRGNTKQKRFSQVSYVDNLSNRRAVRNLEGSALYHAFDQGKVLENALRRVTPGYYHAYHPNKLGDRTLLSQNQIDEVMREKGTTVSVDEGGKIKCPG